MIDIVDRETRSRMMSGIRSHDTRPEMIVRRALHAAGFRYRLHVRDLPGTPDIVLPRYHVVIFVHGCFWHRHQKCPLAAIPATRPDFWQKKFDRNIERDRHACLQLLHSGWRIITVWECGLRNNPEETTEAVMQNIKDTECVHIELPFL